MITLVLNFSYGKSYRNKYRDNFSSGQYRVSLPGVILTLVWACHSVVTYMMSESTGSDECYWFTCYMMSESTGSDECYWSDRIMFLYMVVNLSVVTCGS
jgi:hypothetical protein